MSGGDAEPHDPSAGEGLRGGGTGRALPIRHVSPSALARWLPPLAWLRGYDRAALSVDAVAAAVVTVMLVPQSLAYALLAGLPPVVGLYASVLPLALYALFGSSRTLSVGPVAILSLMTASALDGLAPPGTAQYAAAAGMLALLSGAMLLAAGALRLGFLANLLSHPVVSGFISASAIVIAVGQVRHILGVEASGHSLPERIGALASGVGAANASTVLVGGTALAFLWWSRSALAPWLRRRGMDANAAALLARLSPMLAVAVGIAAMALGDLATRGVATVGAVPAGLPPFSLPTVDAGIVPQLLAPAALIALIGFVESVSVARTLGNRRGETVEPDAELRALGATNLGSALSGGFAVTGGFSRSAVNFDAGARTPLAGVLTAGGILVVTAFLTPLLALLPLAVLAATIIVAVLGLVDLGAFRQAWDYSRHDFAAMTTTGAVTLLVGVEAGVLAGVVLSLSLLLWRASRPHIAVVGRVPGTQHYRNVRRHDVETDPAILAVRPDSSLFFANAGSVEDFVLREAARSPDLRHVVLLCSAINEIDLSALDTLEALNRCLLKAGIRLHLSEVKGPVADRLAGTKLLKELGGKVHLSHHAATNELRADMLVDGRSDGLVTVTDLESRPDLPLEGTI